MKNKKLVNTLYIIIVGVLFSCLMLGFVTELTSWDLGSWGFIARWVTSPVALLLGIAFALLCGPAYSGFNKLMSKKLLQYSVIGLGFGMNLYDAIASGSEGMIFTIVSVFGTLGIGWFFGRKLLKVDSQTSYLISSGTAICGGSAIAAVGPIIKAKAESMSVALGVVFVLNAVALFIFPAIGDAIGMDTKQFGTWAAIAIHDTSSVVGAGSAFDLAHPEMVSTSGVSALDVATTIKLTRALWIVVLALLTPLFFKSLNNGQDGQKKPWYKAIPMFIVWFVVAILFNTYVLSNESLLGENFAGIGKEVSGAVKNLAKHMITLSLFFIGAGLTKQTLKAVGLKPLLQGVLLWITISCVSLVYILFIG